MFIENPLNSSPFIFPALECFHLVGFAVAVGTIAMVDFSLLGFGMRRQTAAQLARSTGLWTACSLAIVIFTGMLLFSSDPDMYYLNPAFLLKMFFLLSAITFNYTIHRKVVAASQQARGGALVACISLALWVCVVFGGIFIAFTDPFKKT
jgi:hypothetical protein